jgi:chromosome segregation ATPase
MEPAFPPDDQEARVVDLRPRAAARRLLDAEGELDALRAHLDEVVAERDAARAAVRESQADALAVREELASRLAAETAALSAVAVLRGQVEELRVRADARDARDHALAKLAGELAVTARTAREEVERHAAARVQAEAALEAERRRVAEVEAALAAERERAAHAEGALRTELEALRTARDRAVTAETEARSARRAELEALSAAGDRLRPVEVAAMPDGLILDLGRAAERLRHGAVFAVEVPRRSGWRRLAARLRGK